MNAGASSIEREFADWNSHAVDTEIPKPENAAAISNDSDVDITRPVLDNLV